MELYDELLGIVELFDQEEVEYAICGGIAVAFHPREPRRPLPEHGEGGGGMGCFFLFLTTYRMYVTS